MVRSLKDRTGPYGKAKYRAFTSLEGREWVYSRELVLLAGLQYHSISRLLPRWLMWEYVVRRLSYKFGVGTYEYRLTARGRGWLEAARRDLPMARRFEADLRAWQKWIKPEIPRLMAGKFKDMLAVLKEYNSGY
ncbi:hypothetical protein ACFLW8_05115 [Chloroflexota bacterium]